MNPNRLKLMELATLSDAAVISMPDFFAPHSEALGALNPQPSNP